MLLLPPPQHTCLATYHTYLRKSRSTLPQKETLLLLLFHFQFMAKKTERETVPLSRFGVLVAQLESIVASARQQPPDALLCFDLLSDLVSLIEEEPKASSTTLLPSPLPNPKFNLRHIAFLQFSTRQRFQLTMDRVSATSSTSVIWSEHFFALQESILYSQRKCEDALFSLLILGARRPVRRLASVAMGRVIFKGDGISIYSRASSLQGWLSDGKRGEPLSCAGDFCFIWYT